MGEQGASSSAETTRQIQLGVNELFARTGQLLEQLHLAAGQVLEEYKAESRKIGKQRRGESRFMAIPWPEFRETSPGSYGAYWRRIEPTGRSGRFRFKSTQIKRLPGNDPYPRERLVKYTDELNRELVLSTERELRKIETAVRAFNRARRLIREAIRENGE